MTTATEPQALILACSQWRETLVQYRETLNVLKNNLYQWASGKTDAHILQQMEHYHNQFHIQLINVHDLKHAIREHLHQVAHHPNFGHKIPHHHLEEQFNALIKELDVLQNDFELFIAG